MNVWNTNKWNLKPKGCRQKSTRYPLLNHVHFTQWKCMMEHQQQTFLYHHPWQQWPYHRSIQDLIIKGHIHLPKRNNEPHQQTKWNIRPTIIIIIISTIRYGGTIQNCNTWEVLLLPFNTINLWIILVDGCGRRKTKCIETVQSL